MALPDIVDRALEGYCELVPRAQVDVFDVPGAFEMPLLARDLAAIRAVRRSCCGGFGGRRWDLSG